jgi:thermitase
MPGYDHEEPAAQVDIVDQIIVGFNKKLGALGMDAALALLEALPAKILTKFTAGSTDDDAFFAFAIIRYDGDKSLPELQEELTANEHIAWVERNAPVTPSAFNDPLFAQQWALTKLGATDTWTVVPPPGRTIIGVVDSGLRRLDGTVHVDLVGKVAPAVVCQPPGFFVNCVDMVGHGTLLAGTIAARPGNNIGVSSAIPFNWNIGLLPVQFFSADVAPNAAYAAIGILQAARNLVNPLFRARVINASWHVGPGDGGLATLRAALNVAVNFYGCVVVFAAGNDGTDNEHFPIYPANFGSEAAFTGKVLTVLATDRYDAKASFSNYGRHVNLGAPGQEILSTGPYLCDPPRYASYSGTSPAAAFASAGAALVLALNPGWTHRDVVQHLIASADTIETLTLACIGGKRLNLKRAVYGPLRVTAPMAAAILHEGVMTNIVWTTDYTNPKFSNVKIEYSKDDGANWTQLAPPPPQPMAGFFPWTPGAADVTPPGKNGQIRITPTNGNFSALSGLFKVVV